MPRDTDRRNTIISGASQLFLLHGYDGVTVDEICALTNSAKGSFYHFFQSKEDLAIQLVDEVWRQTESRMEETFAADKPPLDRIRDELTYIYSDAYILQNRSRQYTGCPIGTLSVTFSDKSPKIRKRVNFALNHIRHFYIQAFVDAQEAGAVSSDQNPAQLADLLFVTVQGVGIVSRSYNSQAKIKRLVDSIMPLFSAKGY